MSCTCDYCENLIPEFEYSYSEKEGEKETIKGFNCFLGHNLFPSHCNDCVKCYFESEDVYTDDVLPPY